MHIFVVYFCEKKLERNSKFIFFYGECGGVRWIDGIEKSLIPFCIVVIFEAYTHFNIIGKKHIIKLKRRQSVYLVGNITKEKIIIPDVTWMQYLTLPLWELANEVIK